MNLVALAIGGFIGTMARYALDGLIPPLSNGFPLGIFAINAAGCFALGWLSTIAAIRALVRPAVRLGLGTGMLGAFTTFSTFSLQAAVLLRNGHSLTAVLYVTSSIGAGLLLAFAGIRLARRMNGEVSA